MKYHKQYGVYCYACLCVLEELPFCKESLQKKIIECGGSVLDNFELEAVSHGFY